jgi:hypothetical protein
MRDIFQILTDITVGTMTVKVSTVDLSLPEYGIANKGYETALIFDADKPNEHIEVVANYSSLVDAVAGHAAFQNPDVIRAITFASLNRCP